MNEERTFTQQELDQILNERLKRERAKFQQEADRRAAELDKRERMLEVKADWQRKGLPVGLLDSLDLSEDSLANAEAVLQGYELKDGGPKGVSFHGGMPCIGGAPHFSQGDPMRQAFGLGKDG